MYLILEVCGIYKSLIRLLHIQQSTIQNRNVNISVLNDALWDKEHLHLVDLWIRSISTVWKVALYWQFNPHLRITSGKGHHADGSCQGRYVKVSWHQTAACPGDLYIAHAACKAAVWTGHRTFAEKIIRGRFNNKTFFQVLGFPL